MAHILCSACRSSWIQSTRVSMTRLAGVDSTAKPRKRSQKVGLDRLNRPASIIQSHWCGCMCGEVTQWKKWGKDTREARRRRRIEHRCGWHRLFHSLIRLLALFFFPRQSTSNYLSLRPDHPTPRHNHTRLHPFRASLTVALTSILPPGKWRLPSRTDSAQGLSKKSR
jgi:hypothetical protein